MDRISAYILKGRICVLAALAAGLICGCTGKGGQTVEMGPEETVEAFCRAVAGCDFSKAYSLCDTVAMSGYLADYQARIKEMAEADSSAAGIASSLLGAAEIKIGESRKEGDRRIVHYSIDAGMGISKEKIATVKKEEGVWKVEKLTDAL